MRLWWVFLITTVLQAVEVTGEKAGYRFIGSHFLASYYECDPEVLKSKERLVSSLTEAVQVAGATLLQVASYEFAPAGVTIVALLSESHASIHTYPEFNACFVDFFTCGDQCDYTIFDAFLKKALYAGSSTSQYILRH